MQWRDLLSSLSVAVLAIAVWGHLSLFLGDRTLARRIILGLLMGCAAAGSMFFPMQVAPGLIYDLRTPLLAVTGLIGGAPAAALAAILAIVCRLSIGGVGQWAGSAGIIVVASLGCAAHALTPRHKVRLMDLPFFAALVTAGSALTIFLLPGADWKIALQNYGPLALLNFGGAWLFALSLMRDEWHRSMIENNEIFKSIIEALPDSLNAKDRQSRFLAANPATARLMRAPSVADLIGKSDSDFYPADMACAFRAEEAAVLDNRKVGPIDQEVEFPDGSRRWLTTLKSPLINDKGEIIGIITHNRDITECKELEAALGEMKIYLHEALANMADGLVLYDFEGRIKFCNQKYRDLFPLTADLRIEGGTLSDILREAGRRGEEEPKADLEAWIAERLLSLRKSTDRLINLRDGRVIEVRTRQVNGSNALVVFTDITAKKQIERDLQRRAAHDALTGLPNRAEFDARLDLALRKADGSETGLAVIVLDLDRFKPVNDTFGHAVGDQLLIEIARRLQASVRADDVVARLGGDEFAFLISATPSKDAASRLADRVLKALAKPFRSGGIELVPGGSLGIAYFPRDGANAPELMAAADKAAYDVKKLGGGRWLSFYANRDA